MKRMPLVLLVVVGAVLCSACAEEPELPRDRIPAATVDHSRDESRARTYDEADEAIDRGRIKDLGVLTNFDPDTSEFAGIITSDDPEAVARALHGATEAVATLGYEGEQVADGEGVPQLFHAARVIDRGVYFWVDSESEVTVGLGRAVYREIARQLILEGVDRATIAAPSTAEAQAFLRGAGPALS